MTFKHTKFEDSSTMRSLVKVAQEKGWVKEEPLKKVAAPKLNLIPSKSFIDNLLKLCNGLRSSGFDKQAEELESKFIQCKQAGALYDVGNETGEDLVHAAHPKGSHKLEDVDSKEATFEDILDKHIKMLDVVNSKPTGKNSTAQDILKTVKSVLTQNKVSKAEGTLDDLYAQATDALAKFRQIYDSINLQLGKEAGSNNTYFNTLQNILDKKQVYNSQELEDSLTNSINSLKNDEEPGWFANSEETQKWQDTILPMIGISNKYASQWHTIIAKIHNVEASTKTQEVATKFDPDAQPKENNKAKEPVIIPQAQKLTALVNKLNAYKLISSIAKNQAAMKWIGEQIGEINVLLSNVQKPEAQTVMSQLEKEITEKESEVSQFASTWLGQG